MRTLTLLLAFTGGLFAQAVGVNQVQGPPPSAYEKLFFYDGSNNLQYICMAQQNQRANSYSVSGSTLTSIVVATNVGTVTFGTAPGLYVGARITVSGSTTAALNGAYQVTAVSGATVTITTSGVSDATYSNAALTVTTNNPLTGAAIWAIQVFSYNVSNQLIDAHWAGGSAGEAFACSNRASY
jgi:hypothetical protein